jgi:hypothetical protein
MVSAETPIIPVTLMTRPMIISLSAITRLIRSQQSDELALLHSITSSARASSDGGKLELGRVLDWKLGRTCTPHLR